MIRLDEAMHRTEEMTVERLERVVRTIRAAEQHEGEAFPRRNLMRWAGYTSFAQFEGDLPYIRQYALDLGWNLSTCANVGNEHLMTFTKATPNQITRRALHSTARRAATGDRNVARYADWALANGESGRDRIRAEFLSEAGHAGYRLYQRWFEQEEEIARLEAEVVALRAQQNEAATV